VDKLPILYSEFAEAAAHTKDKTHFIAMFSGAQDLIQRTPGFWEKYVQPKLNREFGGAYQYLSEPYPDGPNSYLSRIEANMDRIRERLVSSASPRKTQPSRETAAGL
jgi:hypothetical protein